MYNTVNEELVERIKDFIDEEGRSCSMDLNCITPEYIHRMWGGKVPQEEIEAALPISKERWEKGYR